MASERMKARPPGNFEDILSMISTFGLAELEKLKSELNINIARKKAPFLPKKEVTLLKKIYKELPKKMFDRYDELYAKIQSPDMPEEERNELSKIIEKFEKRDVERLSAILELAQLRNISPDKLMSELQIRLPQNA